MTELRVLLLPGWLDSDAGHWQSRWERLHGYERVVQDDWLWPRRGDWMARLEDVLLASDAPALLVELAIHPRHQRSFEPGDGLAKPDLQ